MVVNALVLLAAAGLASAAEAGHSIPIEACIIERPVEQIMLTDPTEVAAAHCVKPSEAEQASLAEVDGNLLRRGTYHLFALPNLGELEVEWTGRGDGPQLFVNLWEGGAYRQVDLRITPGSLLSRRMLARQPESEPKVFLLVNGAGVATDAVRARLLSAEKPQAPSEPAPPAKTSPYRMYVQADVVRLRESPSDRSGVAGRLRIDTQVEVVEEQGDWARVRYLGMAARLCDERGACRPLQGWVPRTLLAPAKATRDELWARVRAGGGAAAAERLVAADGTEEAQWQALLAAYQAEGPASVEKRKRVADLLAGEVPVYWATCAGDSGALLVAATTSEGVSEPENLERLAEELAAAPWYWDGPKGPQLITGTPFAGPKVAEISGKHRLVLGSCPTAAGGLLTTFPMVAAPSEPLADPKRVAGLKRAARKAAGARAKAVEVTTAPGEIRSVRLCRKADSCFGWMLFDVKGRPLPLSGSRKRSTVLVVSERDAEVPPARWLAPSFGRGYSVGAVLWSGSTVDCEGESCGSSSQSGVWLVWTKEGKLEPLAVLLEHLEA